MFQDNREITPSMRCRLINWLLEVCIHFRLHRETLYLAIYYTDRYLTLRGGVSKRSLQLLGVSALFVAAKLEEIYPPNIRDFEDVCDGSCPALMIHETEVNLLMTLRWHLNVATPLYWAGLYLNLMVPHLSEVQVSTIELCVLRTLDMVMHTPLSLRYSYSQLAASTLLLPLVGTPDSRLVPLISGFTSAQLSPCFNELKALYLEITSKFEFPRPEIRCRAEQFDRIVAKNALIMQSLLAREGLWTL